MALFGSRKKTEETKAAAPATSAKVQTRASGSAHGIAHILKNPRITEKASDMQAMSVYAFDIATNATKTQVMEAVKTVYKVNPRKIRIVQIPSKRTRSMRTGRSGVKTGGKKAYVYLASGETITVA